jgi:hypothetical protein
MTDETSLGMTDETSLGMTDETSLGSRRDKPRKCS